MKKTLGFLILILTLTFQSCTKGEDDLISQNCEIDCTEIIGKLMTDFGTTPIANHKVTVIWDNTRFASGTVRTKATTRTDSNGEFYLKFFIRDDELNEGIHRLYYDELNGDEFLRADLNGITIYPTIRDTIMLRNHNVPKKAFLNLSIMNLDDLQEGDSFSTNFKNLSPIGFSQSVGGSINPWSNDSENDRLIEIAANQPVILEIIRDINDVITRESDTLFVNSGTTFNYTVDFNN
ncbi:hypothetical protein RM545_17145 [Zunongwangia sp. F260]|uniref:Lipoprotein n=1 Tax=Autumnicola lenta TaxID=3075593 RepID=A0ABU3CQ69_9FLAO|nr:hypothetical protein [Zunongwangia sp. F260]MDT0648421.1 hypothetical protein [Zunongwangia sp. F260]